MYSSAFYFTLQTFTRFSSFLGIMPGEFCVETRRFEMGPRNHRHTLGLISYFFLTTFVLSRTLQMFFERQPQPQNKTVNASEYAICAAHCLLFALTFGAVLYVSWFRHRIIPTLNRNILHFTEFRSRSFSITVFYFELNDTILTSCQENGSQTTIPRLN